MGWWSNLPNKNRILILGDFEITQSIQKAGARDNYISEPAKGSNWRLVMHIKSTTRPRHQTKTTIKLKKKTRKPTKLKRECSIIHNPCNNLI